MQQNPSDSRLRFSDFVLVAIGITSSFSIRIVGDLPIGEVLAAVCLPFLLGFRRRALLLPRVGVLLALLVLWLANQIVTDLYRGTETVDWLRGDANIVFFLVDLLALIVLVSTRVRSQVIFALSYGVGSLLAARFQPSDFAAEHPWKFGYAEGVNLLVALSSCYFFKRKLNFFAILLLWGILLVNLLDNFRSPVLNILVALVLVFFPLPERIGRLKVLPRKGSIAYVLVVLLLTGLAGAGAAGLVRLSTTRGLISEQAQSKNQAQARGSGGMFLGGRPEILVSTRAVYDAPILGHGSWAKDFKYTEMLTDIQSEWGIDTDLRDLEAQGKGTIPSHSHLMGAWVQAGVFGAVFWFYLFALTVKAILRTSVSRPVLAPFYVFEFANLFWDIWLSPFGSTQRLIGAFLTAIILGFLGTQAQSAQASSASFLRNWRRQQFAVHPQA